MSRTVFVITPIGKEDSRHRHRADDFYNAVVVPAVDDYNRAHKDEKDFERLLPERADKIGKSGVISVQVVEHIAAATLCVVDLTDQNANVMYELGIADVFGKPTIRVVDDPDKLPFDTADHRTYLLASIADGYLRASDAQDAKLVVLEQIEHILSGDYRLSSVVASAALIRTIDDLAAKLTPGDSESAVLQVLSGLVKQVADLGDRLDRVNNNDRRSREVDDSIRKLWLSGSRRRANPPNYDLFSNLTGDLPTDSDVVQWLKRDENAPKLTKLSDGNWAVELASGERILMVDADDGHASESDEGDSE